MPSILEALENRGLSNMAIYLQGAGNLLLQASLKRLFALKKKQTKPNQTKTQAKCILLLSDICGKHLPRIHLVHLSSGSDLLNHYCQNMEYIFH